MLLVSTRDFGEIEVAEDSVVEFPHGLPAFEDERRFVLIHPPTLAPLIFLQSAASQALAFTALPMPIVDAGYELSVLAEDFEAVGCPAAGDLAVYALLTFSDDGRATANLLAPIVVNTGTRKATQAVRADSRYSHKHPLGYKRCS
jgi:flagellar assembly factor FliW